MPYKFLYNNAGETAEFAAINSSAGAGDADKIPRTDSTGRLDLSFMPVGIGVETELLECTENLAAGAFVNVYLTGGVAKCRNADASGGNAKKAHGYVLAAFLSGATATVYYGNKNTQCSGMTIGSRQYLSATPGAPTATAPSTTAYIRQALGTAISATEMLVNLEPTVTLV